MVLPHPARPARGRPRRWPTYTHRVTPQETYTRALTIPLSRAGQATVNGSGVATVSVGPAGVGNKWYPMTATFSTTTGPNDQSQAVIYYGFVSEATLLNGQAYHGGGDSAGLAIPMMTPGDLIVAQWTGAHAGDVAQLTIVGTQDALVVA